MRPTGSYACWDSYKREWFWGPKRLSEVWPGLIPLTVPWGVTPISVVKATEALGGRWSYQYIWDPNRLHRDEVSGYVIRLRS